MPLPVDPRRLAAVALLMALPACSQELYGEAQDGVTYQFGDAVASNRAAQMIDPWAAHTADTRLTYKGRPMNAAIDRYYTGEVLPPVAIGTNAALDGASKSVAPGGGSKTN
jgi:hypothetical protein